MRMFLKALWPLYISIWIIAALALTGRAQVSGWPWPFTALSTSSATIGTRNLVVGGASQSDFGLSVQASSTGQAGISMRGTGGTDYILDLSGGTGYVFNLLGSQVAKMYSSGAFQPTGAIAWNNNTDLLELNAPRIEFSDIDTPSVLADTGEFFGDLKASQPITIRAARIWTQHPAGSCTTKPIYELCSAANFVSCANVIVSSCTPGTAIATNETDCSTTVTSVPAGTFVFWENTTGASACAASFALQYEYTTN